MAFTKVTEQSSLHDNLDQKSVGELLREMNEEDQKVALAVKECIPQIEKLVEGIVEREDPEIVLAVLFVFISWALPYLFPRAPGPMFNYSRVSLSIGKHLTPSFNH